MNKFDEEFDFVVAGSGGGSMCAAVYLQARGKRVLILEKTEPGRRYHGPFRRCDVDSQQSLHAARRRRGQL